MPIRSRLRRRQDLTDPFEQYRKTKRDHLPGDRGDTEQRPLFVARHDGQFIVSDCAQSQCAQSPERGLALLSTKRDWVHPDDRDILDGIEELNQAQQSQTDQSQNRSASERSEMAKQRARRHVWVAREGMLRAVPIVTGISDSRTTELVEGELKEGDDW